MDELGADLPAAGVVRVVGPEEAGAGFLVSASGLIVTCAHVLAGCAAGATVSIEPHIVRRSLPATVDLLQDPPDVAILRLTAPIPSEAVVLPLGRSPRSPQPDLLTFGYPQVRPETGLPGALAVLGGTADAGYDQLALRSEEATLGFSGAPIWDPKLGVVVGMVKSIARGDPGRRLSNTAIGVPVEIIREVCPELRLPAGCPYRGLEPFTEEYVDYYYGREHATSQLLTSLAAGHFVAVVAVSGGGKSSLLQAGLAKGLRDRPVVGLAQRIRCYQRVGSQPHTELLQSLAQHGILLPQKLATAPPQELAAAIHGAVPPAELIVVVDQFERLYTDCDDAAERKRFVELLWRLATDTVKVVIGLRADFYHLALADLGERLAAGQVALAPMSEQDLGRAIAAPAEKLLRSFQPGLTQQLIADVRGRPGDLPLLQFALTELWDHDAAGGVITEETYRGMGAELPDGTARLWDVATHRQIGGPLTISDSTVDSVAFSPDGTILATGSDDGTARLWNVATHRQIGGPLTIPGTSGLDSAVYSVAFSPDGRILATGSGGGIARLWDVATHRQIGGPLTDPGSTVYNTVYSVAFSPDGTILATGSDDGTARLWNVATHRQTGDPLTIPGTPEKNSAVFSVAFSPDGTILATGSDDGAARLWDVATRLSIGDPLPNPAGPVWSVAFSRDGRTLATGSADGTARLWDVAYLVDTVPHLCASARRSLTRTEWAQYAPGSAYRSICP
jgi:hypothetical protein